MWWKKTVLLLYNLITVRYEINIIYLFSVLNQCMKIQSWTCRGNSPANKMVHGLLLLHTLLWLSHQVIQNRRFVIIICRGCLLGCHNDMIKSEIVPTWFWMTTWTWCAWVYIGYIHEPLLAVHRAGNDLNGDFLCSNYCGHIVDFPFKACMHLQSKGIRITKSTKSYVGPGVKSQDVNFINSDLQNVERQADSILVVFGNVLLCIP